MDIEGEEIPVLEEAPSCAFERIVQMSIEFHDFLDPQSRPAIRAVIKKIQQLGFFAIKFSARSHGDLLFINQRLTDLSGLDEFSLRIQKYCRGFGRIIRRAVAA
jgi:hypothetical protein